jgi:hypothetical protein
MGRRFQISCVLALVIATVAAGREPLRALQQAAADELVRMTWMSFEKGVSCTSSEAAYVIGAAPDGGTDMSGVRGLYCYAARALPAIVVEGLAGVPIFQSGPHQDGKLNLATTGFGHYNPAFVRWAGDHLVPGTRDAAFKKATQSIYDTHARDLARAYASAHRYFEERPNELQRIARDYKAAIAAAESGAPGGAAAHPARVLSDAVDSAAGCIRAGGSRLEYGQVAAAAAFWVRRAMDGTRGQFSSALSGLLKAYDPAFTPAVCK